MSNVFVPAIPIHPGEYLRDELEARGWTLDDLSDVTGITKRQIINVTKGASGVTAESAQAIGAAFDQDPVTWMNLQVAYELASAAKEQRDVAKRAKLYDLVPVREMTRRGWIPKTNATSELESAVCKFLDISNVDESPALRVAARKSTDYAFTSPAQLAWYYGVRRLGESAPITGTYKKGSWSTLVEALRPLAASAPDARQAPATLAEFGIRLVLVKHLKGTKSDGVALWIDDSSPVIGLSLRFDRIDNFWFTLMHELAHVHHKHESPVDEDLLSDSPDKPEMETVADDAASSALVPTDRLDSFIARCDPLYYRARVVQFAKSIDIHPGIVVGQLQHRKKLTYQQFAPLKEKVREHIRGQALTDGWGDSPMVERP